MYDENERVRKEVGSLVRHLRGGELRPHSVVLSDLIASPACGHAFRDIFLTLDAAPDRVDDLVYLAACRFVDGYRQELTEGRFGSAGTVHYVADLVVRGLAQTRDRERVHGLLDVLDRLFEFGVYGVDRAVDGAERG